MNKMMRPPENIIQGDEHQNLDSGIKMRKGKFFLFSIIFFILLTSCIKQVEENDLSYYNPVTFSFYSGDQVSHISFNDPVAKEIIKRTGVTLDVHPYFNEQDIPLMISSGNYTDFIYAKNDIIHLIDENSVVALDDYVDENGNHINLIEEYGENLRKLYGKELTKLRYTDGHIYSFGAFEVHTQNLEPDATLQLQFAVLDELGYPEIKNIQQYADAIRAYKKKYPTINGKETIGLSLLTTSWHWYINLSNMANYIIGYADDGQWMVDRETYEAKYKFLEPEIKYYYKFLNELYNDGTLDPDSFTQDENTWKEKISSGRVLGIVSPKWEYDDARKNLIASGMGERAYAALPIVADETKYKNPSLTDYGYSGGWGISIARSCKNVILAFKFIDWMCSEEAQILTNWGIENVNYYVQDGIRHVTEDERIFSETDALYSRKTGIGLWCYPFPQMGEGAKDSNGDWITPHSRESIIKNYLPEERKTLKAYGVKMWHELFPDENELYKPVYGQLWQYQFSRELAEKISLADDYVHKALVDSIVCAPQDFDSQWNNMVQNLIGMGVENMGKEVTDLIKAKLDLWGLY